MNDSFCDGLWQLSDNFIDEEEEAEYFQVENEDVPFQITMETKEVESYDVALEALVSGSMSLSAVCYLDHGRPSQSKPVKSTKDRVFVIDEKVALAAIQYQIPNKEKRKGKRAAKKRAAKNGKKHAEVDSVKEPVEPPPPPTVPVKPSEVITVQADDVTEENLRGKFGDCFIKGQCMPPRFAINISESVIEHLASHPGNPALSKLLQQTGHHIFTILECALDPWQVIGHDGRLVESIRMKVSGVDEGQETLTGALSRLESDRITDVVDAVSQSVALLPAER